MRQQCRYKLDRGWSGVLHPTLTGSLTVFAAASLTEAFNDATTNLEAANPGLMLTYSFAGSQQLVTEVADGAPADVIATADMATVEKLVSAGLVDTPRVFARNRLDIAVAKGNPKHIRVVRRGPRPAKHHPPRGVHQCGAHVRAADVHSQGRIRVRQRPPPA